MTANFLGSLIAIIWIGIGLGVSFFLLNRTSLLENAQMNLGLTATELRRKFRYIFAIGVAAAGVIGWFGGPVLFGSA